MWGEKGSDNLQYKQGRCQGKTYLLKCFPVLFQVKQAVNMLEAVFRVAQNTKEK